MDLSVPKHILSLKPYTPGKPLEELEREYGITNSVKLASNENPLGPSPKALSAIQAATANLNRYPDGSGHALASKLSQKLNVAAENIVLGNGSDEIIAMLAQALLQPGHKVILPKPSFLLYDVLVRCAGAVPVYIPLNSLSIDLDAIIEKITPGCRMVFLCNPNNPTGTNFTQTDFEYFLNTIPADIIVVVDEAYIEFVRDPNCADSIAYLQSRGALVTLRTFSKAYGLAGLRIGYGVMPPSLAELLNRIRLPFNANSLALAGAVAALDDDAFLEKTISLVHDGLDFMYESLNRLGIKYFTTQSNFFLIDVKTDADEIFNRMLKEGLIVRSMKAYGYPSYIRVNVGVKEENMCLLSALEKLLK
jgi:histidinol-phosphate aminotransferase